jgi:lysophospholipase L1-like esterase
MRRVFLLILLVFAISRLDAAMPDDPTSASLAHIRQKMEAKEHFTIVALGDSVTEVNWTSRGHLNWVGLLQASLFESGHAGKSTVINSGISGSTFTDGLARVERDVLRHNPDLVIIGFGIYDWMFSDIPAEKSRQDMHALIGRIRAAGDASILIRTPHPVMNREMTEWVEPPEYTAALKVIREVAAQEKIAVVDHYASWTNPHPDPKVMMYDWIHPNEVGHQRFFNEIAPVLGLKTRLRWMGE